VPNFNPWEYVSDDAIRVVDGTPSNPKKMTGSRLGAIVGVNKWKSPFEAWCEITRVGEQPFEGNKFTEAGEAIEPKLLEFCKSEVSPYIVTPSEWFKTTRKLYDHFPDEAIFGGQWDALALDAPLAKGGKPIAVIEAKTSSRPQDWVNGVPDSYAVQGLAYAAWLGVDLVYFPVRFMEPHEYDAPHLCECDDANTEIYEMKVAGSGIHDTLTGAMAWYETHVLGNVSPSFDAKRDKDILKVIRTNEVKSDGLEALAKKALVLESKIELIRSDNGLDALEKELKALKDKQLKPLLVEQFGENDETVTAYGWSVKKSMSTAINKEALEQDGLLETYTVSTPRYTMTRTKE